MIGFLAPDGKFIKCESWEHTSKASKICKKKYNIDLSGIPAEDFILAKGYLVIRAGDAYMSYWDKHGVGKTLSEKQLQWIDANCNDFNERQKEDINEILLDNGKNVRRGFEQFQQ